MDPLKAITESVPPATDPLSWLVILEVNLTPELLPALHDILSKNLELTSAVGWDLIPLLLPIPGSGDCQKVIGRYGNPRECVIKVCEQLRELDFEEPDQMTEAEDEGQEKATSSEGTPDISKLDIKPPQDLGASPTNTTKLITLIRLLSVLHPRIRTKHPSRFLSTSLSALLATYSDAVHFVPPEDITLEIIRFVKNLSGVKRPHLPHRYSSSQHAILEKNQEVSGDPEATEEAPAPEEQALSTRLLSSFVTHVLEDYINSMENPGLAWSARFNEKSSPEKIVPGRSFVRLFAQDESLQARDSTVGQLVALARDLNLDDDDLLKTITQPIVEVERNDDGPPSSPSDIPLSEAGSLFLLTSRIASATLFGSSSTLPPLFVFPDLAAIAFKFIGQAESGGASSIGTEPEAVVDAVLAIGMFTAHNSKIGDVKYEGDEKFSQFLQSTSLLSANTPNPTLRYQAHVLTSIVLHSHPDDLVRLSFIRDTLEYCPFENLKGSAVEWLKTETLSALPATENAPPTDPSSTSIFATPVAIDMLAPYLFPDLRIFEGKLTDTELPEQWPLFKANLSFYLASMNFYYLLLSARHLREAVDLKSLQERHQIDAIFGSMLRKAVEQFRTGLQGILRDEEGEEGVKMGLVDLEIVEDVLERIKSAESVLGK